MKTPSTANDDEGLEFSHFRKTNRRCICCSVCNRAPESKGENVHGRYERCWTSRPTSARLSSARLGHLDILCYRRRPHKVGLQCTRRASSNPTSIGRSRPPHQFACYSGRLLRLQCRISVAICLSEQPSVQVCLNTRRRICCVAVCCLSLPPPTSTAQTPAIQRMP